jgi:hypothetical protein
MSKKVKEEKTDKQQINVEASQDLYERAHKRGLDWLIKTQTRFGRFMTDYIIPLGLYIDENLDWAETKRAIMSDPTLACVLSAFNELSHEGLDLSKPRTGDELVRDIESFQREKKEKETKNQI